MEWDSNYYSFGLTMAGISAKAPGRLENKKEKFQGQPLDDATYAFSENKVTAHVELKGLETIFSPLIFGSNPPIVRTPIIEQVAKPALELGAKTSELAGKAAETGAKVLNNHP